MHHGAPPHRIIDFVDIENIQNQQIKEYFDKTFRPNMPLIL